VTALGVYRDDGPLVASIGRHLGRLRLSSPVSLTVVGALPLAAVLASYDSTPAAVPAFAALVLFILLAAPGSARPETGRLAWTVPPLLRLVEYGFLIRLTVLADRGAMSLCFAALGVLAFHHYDAVYRLRHQRRPAPGWTRAIGGGWEGRLVVAYVLALAGALEAGLLVASVVLAIVYVGEGGASWLRFARATRSAAYDDDDEDDA
jgi:uncharacterized protein DUF5941